MVKLLTALLLTYSCQSSREIPAVTLALEKRILVEASSQSAAGAAQSIVHAICPPKQIEISEEGPGTVRLRFKFLITFPRHFDQMMAQLAQLPGITLLKEQ